MSVAVSLKLSRLLTRKNRVPVGTPPSTGIIVPSMVAVTPSAKPPTQSGAQNTTLPSEGSALPPPEACMTSPAKLPAEMRGTTFVRSPLRVG